MISIEDQIRKLTDHMKMTRLNPKPKLDFVPVIFANGEDNDVPGLIAAANGERVQFKDKIYDRDESITFDHEMFGLANDINIQSLNGLWFKLTNIINNVQEFTATCNSGRILKFNICKYKWIKVRM